MSGSERSTRRTSRGSGCAPRRIDVFDRPSDLGFDARNPKCDALVRFHFVPAGEGATTVSCDVDLTFKGAMKFVAPLMAGKVRKSIETERGPGAEERGRGAAHLTAGPPLRVVVPRQECGAGRGRFQTTPESGSRLGVSGCA